MDGRGHRRPPGRPTPRPTSAGGRGAAAGVAEWWDGEPSLAVAAVPSSSPVPPAGRSSSGAPSSGRWSRSGPSSSLRREPFGSRARSVCGADARRWMAGGTARDENERDDENEDGDEVPRRVGRHRAAPFPTSVPIRAAPGALAHRLLCHSPPLGRPARRLFQHSADPARPGIPKTGNGVTRTRRGVRARSHQHSSRSRDRQPASTRAVDGGLADHQHLPGPSPNPGSYAGVGNGVRGARRQP